MDVPSFIERSFFPVEQVILNLEQSDYLLVRATSRIILAIAAEALVTIACAYHSVAIAAKALPATLKVLLIHVPGPFFQQLAQRIPEWTSWSHIGSHHGINLLEVPLGMVLGVFGMGLGSPSRTLKEIRLSLLPTGKGSSIQSASRISEPLVSRVSKVSGRILLASGITILAIGSLSALAHTVAYPTQKLACYLSGFTWHDEDGGYCGYYDAEKSVFKEHVARWDQGRARWEELERQKCQIRGDRWLASLNIGEVGRCLPKKFYDCYMKEDFWRFSRGHYFEGECFNGTSLRHLFSGAHKETFKVPFIEPKAEPALMPAWLLPAFLWVSGAAMLLGVFKLNQLVFKYSQLFRPLLEEAEQVKNASDSILNRMSNGAENLNTIGQTLRNTPPVSKTYFDDKVAEIIRVVDSLTERIATNNRYQEESLSNLVRKLENFANVIPALVRHVLKEEKSR